jgi:co-chaperonin GroES (HSP10)
MDISPLNADILFQFIDDLTGEALTTKTKSGLALAKDYTYSEQKDPRWAKVMAVGPKVKDDGIINGEYILIEPLMWTVGVQYKDQMVWKTDESKIMATSPEEIYRY